MRLFSVGKKSWKKLATLAPDVHAVVAPASTTEALSRKAIPPVVRKAPPPIGSYLRAVLAPASTTGAVLSRKAIPPAARREPSSIGSIVEQLKKEERRQFSSKRLRFDHASNYTAALALPCSNAQLSRARTDQNALLKLAEQHIVEHANRRVDLFFYTLIAYYQSKLIPVEGHTTLQHGRGRTLRDNTNLTQACHSSFIPSLLDATIYNNKISKLRYKSLLSGTHLLESLNSTVELPPFVNAFDDFLESICRPKCIKIISDVSQGKINPIEGLTVFLTMMDTLLQDFTKQAAKKGYSSLFYPATTGHHHVSPKLIALVNKGTLNTTFSTDTQSVAEDYIQLMLRMTPEEKAHATGDKKVYLAKIMAMQKEILATKREESACTL